MSITNVPELETENPLVYDGQIEKISTKDMSAVDVLKEILLELKYIKLHLHSQTDEKFKEEDTQ